MVILDLINLLVESRPIAMSAEFVNFHSLGGIPSVLVCCVSRHARRTLGGIGQAFSALESNHYPDALIFSHIKDVTAQLSCVDFTTILHCNLPNNPSS